MIKNITTIASYTIITVFFILVCSFLIRFGYLKGQVDEMRLSCDTKKER